jgi:hypothetical protein
MHTLLRGGGGLLWMQRFFLVQNQLYYICIDSQVHDRDRAERHAATLSDDNFSLKGRTTLLLPASTNNPYSQRGISGFSCLIQPQW